MGGLSGVCGIFLCSSGVWPPSTDQPDDHKFIPFHCCNARPENSKENRHTGQKPATMAALSTIIGRGIQDIITYVCMYVCIYMIHIYSQSSDIRKVSQIFPLWCCYLYVCSKKQTTTMSTMLFSDCQLEEKKQENLSTFPKFSPTTPSATPVH